MHNELNKTHCVPCMGGRSVLHDMAKRIDPEVQRQLDGIGQRLRQLRKREYTSYEHFAYANELNRVTYGRLENGNDMLLSTLLKALRGLGISPAEFFSQAVEEKEDGEGGGD